MKPRIEIRIDCSVFVLRGWQAHSLAVSAGLKPIYNGIAGGWVADASRLPDLLAYLDRRHILYNVIDPAAERSQPNGVAPDTTPATDLQLSLFPIGGRRG